MAKHKILLVEDERSIRDMYAFKLEGSGFLVMTAENGQTGLKLAEEWRPDLILLDLRMPILSGDKMLEKLRHQEWGANIRVIILTNISKYEAPSALRFLNVDNYIVKAHSTPSDVTKAINNILN